MSYSCPVGILSLPERFRTSGTAAAASVAAGTAAAEAAGAAAGSLVGTA